MSVKNNLILFFSFVILASLVSFLIFHREVFAPHKILILGTDESSIAPEAPSENTMIKESDDLEVAPTVTPEDNLQNKGPLEDAEQPIAKDDPTKKLPNTEHQLPVTDKLVSWGFTPASNRKIDTVIIHSSYNALGGNEYDVAKLIAEYQEYGVAPHYLIDREGKIYQLVADKNIAYHAGESKVPDGRVNVNGFSIGIEMINTKEDKYTSDQYTSLNSLLSTLKDRYTIKYVLGHDDIAPERKTDPWNFDWEKVQ